MISFLENIDVGASRPGYKRVKYFNGSYFLIYWCRGLHDLVIGGLNSFMVSVLEYIDVEGASRLGYGRVK